MGLGREWVGLGREWVGLDREWVGLGREWVGLGREGVGGAREGVGGAHREWVGFSGLGVGGVQWPGVGVANKEMECVGLTESREWVGFCHGVQGLGVGGANRGGAHRESGVGGVQGGWDHRGMEWVGLTQNLVWCRRLLEPLCPVEQLMWMSAC